MPLRGQDHGTQVVLLGQRERHDTTQAPTSVTDARGHWITRYLNARFLHLPSQVELLVREQHSRDEPEQLQHVHGEQHHLERRAVAAGFAELSDASARWWVLDNDHRARRREATLWTSTRHAAAVFGDELYDILPQTRGGYGRLQDFGIRFGYERVVLHLQPHHHAGRLECNTARTLLLLEHEPLPWARWGEEFIAAMPDEIRQLQETAANADCLPRREAIRNRISAIMPLYQLSRYRPTRPPRQLSSASAASSRGTELDERPTPQRQARSTPPTAESSQAPAKREPCRMGPTVSRPQATSIPHGDATSGAVDLPDVAWVSARDGSRAPGDLEDQAARYHPARHELTINADFRAITDLTAHWLARYRAIPGAQPVIDGHVREWCVQILVEVVLAARNSSWNPEQLDALLSPASLTAALLPRHLLHATLQKRLGQKLGAPRGDAGGSSPGLEAPRPSTWSCRHGIAQTNGQKPGGQAAGSGHPIIGSGQGGPEL